MFGSNTISGWAHQNIEAAKSMGIEVVEPPAPTPPFDLMSLSTMQQAALLQMHEGHVKRAVIARLLEDAQDKPSMGEYAFLRELGLCEFKVGKRYHDLTPSGRVAASTLQKRLCQTLGIHLKIADDGFKASVKFYCTCGQWSIVRSRNIYAERNSVWAFLRHCDAARAANEALQRMPREAEG